MGNFSPKVPLRSSRLKSEIPKFSEFGVVWFPFLGQPHPLNDYAFASSTNTEYVPTDFAPKYDPEIDLYYFMLELYTYVTKAPGGKITKTQLSRTLNSKLPVDWILRSGALSTINRIMRTRYTLDMRARDYERFKNSFEFYNHFSAYSAQLAEFLSKPGGKLEVWLLSVHPEVREQLMLKYAEHFNVGGHPIYDPTTQVEQHQWLVKSLEASSLDVHKAIRQREKAKYLTPRKQTSSSTTSDSTSSSTSSTIDTPDFIDDYDLFDKDIEAGAKLDTGDGEVIDGVVRKFPTRPCQVMSIDYLPGFVDHGDGFDRLLMVQDRFTKGLFLEAVSSSDTPAGYWTHFSAICTRAGGFPEQLISSGRRTRFKGEFDALCIEHKIKHLRTSAFRPQIGGGLQPAKKRVTRFFKEKTRDNKSAEVLWTQVVKDCETDFNSHVNPVSRVTPYYCMYGQDKPPPINNDTPPAQLNKIDPGDLLQTTWKRVFYRLKAHADSATASYQRRASADPVTLAIPTDAATAPVPSLSPTAAKEATAAAIAAANTRAAAAAAASPKGGSPRRTSKRFNQATAAAAAVATVSASPSSPIAGTEEDGEKSSEKQQGTTQEFLIQTSELDNSNQVDDGHGVQEEGTESLVNTPATSAPATPKSSRSTQYQKRLDDDVSVADDDTSFIVEDVPVSEGVLLTPVTTTAEDDLEELDDDEEEEEEEIDDDDDEIVIVKQVCSSRIPDMPSTPTKASRVDGFLASAAAAAAADVPATPTTATVAAL
ncbi:uncharacterized protein SAPINGB_P004666 [Magnusiomyces paraingens]|uniref:Integrase catalytic domain-containing protein n=1 Tax=Magnusiomyces paraingens TaxID=2606893 RepID=A0A5E8BY96_9ASCO|nr:uncharacterized protein SAPINGB_P004666 [Saprochaete ingens]VVT55609.1 unnamed protein product [Saprochaete ingens]